MLVEAIIDLWPKRAHNIFTRRRHISKIICLKVEMSILPRCERLFDRASKRDKIMERPTPLVVLTANGCLGYVTMAVAKWIIALAVQLRVFGVGERSSTESVRSMECYLQPKKNSVVSP